MKYILVINIKIVKIIPIRVFMLCLYLLVLSWFYSVDSMLFEIGQYILGD